MAGSGIGSNSHLRTSSTPEPLSNEQKNAGGGKKLVKTFRRLSSTVERQVAKTFGNESLTKVRNSLRAVLPEGALRNIKSSFFSKAHKSEDNNLGSFINEKIDAKVEIYKAFGKISENNLYKNTTAFTNQNPTLILSSIIGYLVGASDTKPTKADVDWVENELKDKTLSESSKKILEEGLKKFKESSRKTASTALLSNPKENNFYYRDSEISKQNKKNKVAQENKLYNFLKISKKEDPITPNAQRNSSRLSTNSILTEKFMAELEDLMKEGEIGNEKNISMHQIGQVDDSNDTNEMLPMGSLSENIEDQVRDIKDFLHELEKDSLNELEKDFVNQQVNSLIKQVEDSRAAPTKNSIRLSITEVSSANSATEAAGKTQMVKLLPTELAIGKLSVKSPEPLQEIEIKKNFKYQEASPSNTPENSENSVKNNEGVAPLRKNMGTIKTEEILVQTPAPKRPVNQTPIAEENEAFKNEDLEDILREIENFKAGPTE